MPGAGGFGGNAIRMPAAAAAVNPSAYARDVSNLVEEEENMYGTVMWCSTKRPLFAVT